MVLIPWLFCNKLYGLVVLEHPNNWLFHVGSSQLKEGQRGEKTGIVVKQINITTDKDVTDMTDM